MVRTLFEFLLSAVATAGFGLIINIPHRALIAAGTIGGVSWTIYWLMLQANLGLALSALTATTVIGILSTEAAKKMRMPMIIFNIPGIVPLVPGGQAYQMVRNFALGKTLTGLDYMMQVVEVAGAIAIGFLLSELVDRVRIKINSTFINPK